MKQTITTRTKEMKETNSTLTYPCRKCSSTEEKTIEAGIYAGLCDKCYEKNQEMIRKCN